MIITLKGADFSENKIGTLSNWTVLPVIDTGTTYSGTRSIEKTNPVFNATLTLVDGYAYSDGVTVTMSGGGTVSQSTSGNVTTLSCSNVTGNITIKALTYNTSTGSGATTSKYTITYRYVDSSGATVKSNTTEQVTAGTVKNFATTDSRATVAGYTCNSVSPTSTTVNDDITVTYTYTATGEGEEPETPTIPAEPADVFQLNTFRYDEDVTVNSGGDTSAKTGYNTFYEIPVLPNSVYYIYGAVRVALLNSSKAYRNDYNIYTDEGSNVGQASYVRTDASTAFLNITVLESKCTIEDAKIQIAQVTTTIKDTKTLASTGATLVTGKKLHSSSYQEVDDENYIVYKDIPVTADSRYKIAGSARVWFLAEDKTTTKGSTNPTTGGVPEKFCFKVPAGAAYISASIYKNNMDKSAEELELHELTVGYSV